MRFVEQKPFSDPDVAARMLAEIANGVEAFGPHLHERVNAPFLAAGGSGDDFRAGIERTIMQVGYGATRAALTRSSPTPARRCLPDGSQL
jgi:hypothetical protein